MSFNLKSTKTILIVVLIILSISSIAFITLSQKGVQQPTPPVLSPTPTPVPLQPLPVTPNGSINMSDPKIESAKISVLRIQKILPIVIDDFKTSTLSTNISIYTLPNDPPFSIRIDVYNIDYENPDTNPQTNPNIAAFKESFSKIKIEIEKHGVLLKDIYLVFGNRRIIQETSENWIKTFDLL